MSNEKVAKKIKVKASNAEASIEPTKLTPNILAGDFAPLYSDRIVNVSLGPGVSKLNFAVEVAPNDFRPTYSLTMPTHALMDALDFMTKMLADEGVKKEFVEVFDKLKARMQ